MSCHLLNGTNKSLGFPDGSAGKGSACSAGNMGSTPELGRSPGVQHGHHSSILAWRIPTDEGPGRLSPCVHKEVDTTEVTERTHTVSLQC